MTVKILITMCKQKRSTVIPDKTVNVVADKTTDFKNISLSNSQLQQTECVFHMNTG